MKWIAALLMIANVAVYLWVSGRQISVDELVNASKPDVNKEGMLLLRETQAVKEPSDALAQQAGDDSSKQSAIPSSVSIRGLNEEVSENADSVVDSEQPGSVKSALLEAGDEISELGGTDASEESVVSSGTALLRSDASTDVAQSCYRVGPFKKDDSWSAALSWMDSQNFPFKHVTSESRELRAVRVYLGPYNSTAGASPTVSLLKDKSLDHFVYQVENGLTRISLGYFTQEELAAKFIEYLQTIEVNAKSQPEYRILGPFNWIEIPFGNVDESQLAGHEWQEGNVSLSKVEC